MTDDCLGLIAQPIAHGAGAVRLHEETLKGRRAKLRPDHPHVLQSLTNLASAYMAARKPEPAIPLLEELLKLQRAHPRIGSDHSDTLDTMGDLASAYRAVRKLDLAVPMFEEILKRQKAHPKFGADHPDVAAPRG